MKVFFVGDTSNRRNWGCRATTYALMRMIKQSSEIISTLDFMELQENLLQRDKFRSLANWLIPISIQNAFGLHNVPNPRSPLNEFREKDASHRNPIPASNSVKQVLKKMIWKGKYPQSLEDFDFFLERFKKGNFLNEIADSIDHCDVVLINGEGSFTEKSPSFPGLMSLFICYLTKKILNKPCIIVNHTSDFRHPVIRRIAECVYSMFDDAVVREPYSYRESMQYRKGRRYLLAPDAVFSLDTVDKTEWVDIVARQNYFGLYPDNAQDFNPSEEYICVGGTAAFHPSRSRYNPTLDYKLLVSELIKIRPVILVSACATDEKFLRIVARDLNLPHVGTSLPTYQALDILSNSALYIGGRWHSSIKATLGGAPIIMLSSNSSYKSRGIVELMHLEQPEISCFDLRKSIPYILELSNKYLSQGSRLRSAIQDRASELRELSYNNVRYISENKRS